MLTGQRREAILNTVRAQGSATVHALAETFCIGEATIRRDLELLQRQRLMRRILLAGTGRINSYFPATLFPLKTALWITTRTKRR